MTEDPTADDPPQPGRLASLPPFTPVPRAKDRANGWKPEVQRQFIEALAETGSVKSAARRVGRAEVGAYLLRRHPEAHEFRRAWDVALDIGMRRIEDVAMDRALNGVEVPVYSYGKLIGARTVYNDRLLMFMLRNRAPERFAAGRAGGSGRPDAVDQMQLARLKRQWRKEWEEEAAGKAKESSGEVIAGINRKLDTMRERRLAGMTERTRALFEAYQAAEEEDRRAGRGAWTEQADAAAREDPDDTPCPLTPEPDPPQPPRDPGHPRELPRFLTEGDEEPDLPKPGGVW